MNLEIVNNEIRGIGDWGLGIGDWDWGLGPIPNPQSPIPNPQSPVNSCLFFHKTFNQDLFIQCGLWAFIKEEFRHKINDEVFNYFNNKKIKDIFILEYQNSSENQSNAKNI